MRKWIEFDVMPLVFGCTPRMSFTRKHLNLHGKACLRNGHDGVNFYMAFPPSFLPVEQYSLGKQIDRWGGGGGGGGGGEGELVEPPELAKISNVVCS